jgi:hypothetical protein
MAQIPDSEIAPEQVRRCIVDSYDQIYAELADQALRNDLRITLDQYKHDKKLVSKVRQSAQDLLKSLNVDADLIVAGFYKDQPVQLVAGGGTSLKVRVEITPGNAVIGSGAIAALKLVELQEAKLHVGIGSLIVASNGSQAVRRSRAVGWAVSSDDLSMAWRIQAVGGRTRIDSRMVEQVWVALER